MQSVTSNAVRFRMHFDVHSWLLSGHRYPLHFAALPSMVDVTLHISSRISQHQIRLEVECCQASTRCTLQPEHMHLLRRCSFILCSICSQSKAQSSSFRKVIFMSNLVSMRVCLHICTRCILQHHVDAFKLHILPEIRPGQMFSTEWFKQPALPFAASF